MKDVDAVVDYYCSLFGYRRLNRENDRITELVPPSAGARLMLHRAAKSARQGQAQAKLAFRVDDVSAFLALAEAKGHPFGSLHDGGGYVYANAKDPAGNSVQVTSRPLGDP